MVGHKRWQTPMGSEKTGYPMPCGGMRIPAVAHACKRVLKFDTMFNQTRLRKILRNMQDLDRTRDRLHAAMYVVLVKTWHL